MNIVSHIISQATFAHIAQCVSTDISIPTNVNLEAHTHTLSMQFHSRTIFNCVMIFSYINAVANSIFYIITSTATTITSAISSSVACVLPSIVWLAIVFVWIIQVEPLKNDENCVGNVQKTKNLCIVCVFVAKIMWWLCNFSFVCLLISPHR